MRISKVFGAGDSDIEKKSRSIGKLRRGLILVRLEPGSEPDLLVNQSIAKRAGFAAGQQAFRVSGMKGV
jgi:hypothetical protein